MQKVLTTLVMLLLSLLTSCSFDKTLEIPNDESETFNFDPKIKVDCSEMSTEDYLFMPNITINNISLIVTHDDICETIDVNVSPNLVNPTILTRWEDLPLGLIDTPLKLFTSPILLKYKEFEADIYLSYTLRYRDLSVPNGYIEKTTTGHLYKNSSQSDLIEVKLEDPPQPITFVVDVVDWEEVSITQIF